jgi:hypothetical protein
MLARSETDRLACLIACIVVQGATLPDPPPEPDFITAVDYAAWFEKQIKGNCRDADNAAPLYRKILGDPPELGIHKPFPLGGGPRWNVDSRPRVWNPTEHPDWEATYQKRRPLIDLYREAARMPYILFERGPSVGADGKPLIRWFRDPYCRYYWPGLPSCASDHAWRAVEGTPDVDVLIDLAGANLGLARQLARDATILSLFRTVSVRWIAHDDLTTALK